MCIFYLSLLDKSNIFNDRLKLFVVHLLNDPGYIIAYIIAYFLELFVFLMNERNRYCFNDQIYFRYLIVVSTNNSNVNLLYLVFVIMTSPTNFYLRLSLAIHKMTHIEEKPFSCLGCLCFNEYAPIPHMGMHARDLQVFVLCLRSVIKSSSDRP